MSEEMNKIWHYTKDNDYPVVFGKYETDVYPQIPCLVERYGRYGIRLWNVHDDCWDDEDGYDYLCDKEGVVRWMYLDVLI